jgi:FtsH-binding integral membrane protein
MMEKKRSVEVMIIGIVFIIWGFLCLSFSIASGPSPKIPPIEDKIVRLFLGYIVHFIFIITGFGLLLSTKEIMRKLAVYVSAIEGTIFSFIAIGATIHGWCKTFDKNCIFLIFAYIAASFCVFSLFCLTRPKVKEQFK